MVAVAGVAAMLCGFPPAPLRAAEDVSVSFELERLADVHGFEVRGLEKTEGAVGDAAEKGLYPRLRTLLENFDHVIIQDPDGGVARVIVLGEIEPFEPPPPSLPARGAAPGQPAAEGGDIVVESVRQGAQHLVQVMLEGQGSAKVQRKLLVDTGADFLVLPLSLASELGMDRRKLREREMQTANGKVRARIGILPALWLGEQRIAGVETAFIEDDKMDGNALLGMSVLGRYKLTIDDDKNRITLGGKEGGEAEEDGKAGQDGSPDPGEKSQ
jgi:clan AA aspartic protease (TIGR02281 family)